MTSAKLLHAACVFVVRDDGRVCSVSRKHDAGLLGLPGGKVEEGETAAQAAARECFEETGMVVGGFRELYAGEDGFGYWCTTFLAGTCSGEARDMGQGHVEWVNPAALLQGHFKEYNEKVLAAWYKINSRLH